MFFCYYSDLINMERFEDFMVPLMGVNFGQSEQSSLAKKDVSPYSKREDVDCFTLKHNMLEVMGDSTHLLTSSLRCALILNNTR